MGAGAWFSSVPLLYMLILTPVLQCCYDSRFGLGFKTGKCESSNSILLFKDCFDELIQFLLHEQLCHWGDSPLPSQETTCYRARILAGGI